MSRIEMRCKTLASFSQGRFGAGALASRWTSYGKFLCEEIAHSSASTKRDHRAELFSVLLAYLQVLHHVSLMKAVVYSVLQ